MLPCPQARIAPIIRHLGIDSDVFCLQRIRIFVGDFRCAVGRNCNPKLCRIQILQISRLHSTVIGVDDHAVAPYRHHGGIPTIIVGFHGTSRPSSKSILAGRIFPSPDAGIRPGSIHLCMHREPFRIGRSLAGRLRFKGNSSRQIGRDGNPSRLLINLHFLRLHTAIVGVDDDAFHAGRQINVIPAVVSRVGLHLVAWPGCKCVGAVSTPRPHARP